MHRRWVVRHIGLGTCRPSVGCLLAVGVTRERGAGAVAPVDDEMTNEPVVVGACPPQRHVAGVVLMTRRRRARVDLDDRQVRSLRCRRSRCDVDPCAERRAAVTVVGVGNGLELVAAALVVDRRVRGRKRGAGGKLHAVGAVVGRPSVAEEDEALAAPRRRSRMERERDGLTGVRGRGRHRDVQIHSVAARRP